MPVHAATNGLETDCLPTPPLAIALLGGFAVSVRGVPLRKLRTRQGNRLLALLALQYGREYDRNTLAAQLWPESTSDAARRASLRRALTDLRAALGEEAGRLTAPSPSSLLLDLSGAAFFDVREFDRAVALQTPAGFDRAIALYRGALMPDLDAVTDLDGVIERERERRHYRFLGALEARAERFQKKNDRDSAIADLRRLLAMDPFRESAVRRMMELLGAQGQRTAALSEYRRLQTNLVKTLGTEPDEETCALAERLQSPYHDRSAIETSNLPYQTTRFVGREQEIGTVRDLLETTRLLTLTGAGGAGKTRLALEIAARTESRYPDGVLLVELAALADPAGVPQAIAAVLGLREQTRQPLVKTIREALRSRRLLLVLDNAEHVSEACAEIGSALLRSCPQVTLFITSREPLGIRGEVTVSVPPLSLPPPQQIEPASPESLASFEAVELFVDRARLAQPGFTVTRANAASVALLCCRLDGIPLALEMAAARVRSLSVDAIAERLHSRFQLLSDGDQTVLPRQQTLRALIDWSYNLLDDDEKRLLLRLTHFAGGWTLAAAERVCGFGGLAPASIAYLLTRLVDKSLIQAETVANEPTAKRYRLLETVRQYGEEKGAAEADRGEVRQRHLQWCIDLAEEAERDFLGAAESEWLNRLEIEHANLRAALDSSLKEGTWEWRLHGLRLAGALWRFYQARGYLSEGRGYLDRLLLDGQSLLAASTQPVWNARLIVARALRAVGILTSGQGEYALARDRQEVSLALFRQIGDKSGIAQTATSLGLAFYSLGDNAAAWSVLSESLCLNRALGNKRGTGFALLNLGVVAAYGLKEYDTAWSLYQESLALFREIGDEGGRANALKGLGYVAANRGDATSARAFLAESLSRFRALGDLRGITYALESMATLYSHSPSACPLAPVLWGAAHTLRQNRGTPLPRSEQEMQDGEVARARAILGQIAWADAWATGTALSWEKAVECALDNEGVPPVYYPG